MEISDIMSIVINPDAYYDMENNLSYEDKGLVYLLFQSFEALDEKWEVINLPALNSFETISQWHKFKKDVGKKWNSTNKMIDLYMDRMKNIINNSMDKEDAKQYWDDKEEDGWPKDKYETFDDWYESNDYHEWENENQQFTFDDFIRENKDISKQIKSDNYINNYGYFRSYDTDDFTKSINIEIKAIDDNIYNNRYNAIIAIFEDL